MFWGIGMSEPESGSDLASVRTRAERTDGGWLIRGRKTWTSGGHRAHAFIVLARTEPASAEDRHAGLSQFIVDLSADGVLVEPIVSMSGTHHFNEITLDDVFVADDQVLGEIGHGWHQVTSELGFERSGPERFLSTFPLLAAIHEEAAAHGSVTLNGMGRHLARLTALHQLSGDVAERLQRHEPADVAAAVVKVLGTTEEGDIVETAEQVIDPATAPSELVAMLDSALLQRPGFTLRGGTTEVLRGVFSRGLGLR